MRLIAAIFSVVFLFATANISSFSQTTERKKPKIKDFGSSLRTPSEETNKQEKRSEKNGQSNEDVIRIETNLVVVECLVTDTKGNVITGLAPQDLIVTENNQIQEIQTFTQGNDAKVPRSIVLIIDYSGSQKPYIERSVEAAKLLVDKLRPNDLMAIVTDDVEIIAQFSSDKKMLKKKLDSLKKDGFFSRNIGKSKQLSSLYAVLQEMFDEEDVRPIIIFQTDGDELPFLKGEYGDLIYPDRAERKTNFSFNEILELTNKSRASIYTVFPGVKLLGLSEDERKEKLASERLKVLKSFGVNIDRIRPVSLTAQERTKALQARIKQYYPNGYPDPQEALSNLSQQTGGWLEFLETPDQADGIYNRILSELNTRYIIGYLPTNETKDGKRRFVKIEVKNHPEYTVWGRKSYIAPSPE